MVEYILVVIVSVIIILSLIQKMYEPFDQFVKTMMGTYVQCLLETGELPNFSSEEESSGECNPFLFAEGEGSEDSEDGEDDKQAGDDSGGSRRDRGSSGRTYAGGGRRSYTVGSGAQATSGVDGATTIKNDSGLGAGRSSESQFFGGGGGGRTRRERYVAFTGYNANELIKREERKREKSTVAPVGDEGGGNQTRKRTNIKPPPPRKIADEGLQAPSWDISQIVKIILIAGIIILIVVLLGGQILSISKNWEKGE